MITNKFHFAMLDQCLVSGVNFILSIILARMMVPAEFGLFVFSFAALVSSVGFANSVVCSPLSVMGCVTDGGEWGKLLYNAILILVIVLVSLTFFFITAWFFLHEGPHESKGRILGVISAVAWMYVGQEFVRRAFLTRLRGDLAFFNSIVTYGLRLLVIVGFTYFDHIDCQRVIYTYGLTSLIGIGLGSIKLNILSIMRENRIEKKILLRIWDYGQWTLAEWLPFVLTGQLYIYIVSFVLGIEATGVLGACRNLVAPATIILVGIMNFALPYFGSVYHEKGHDSLLSSLKKFFFFLILVITVYLVVVDFFSKNLLLMLFGKYSEFSAVVMVYSVGVFINFLFKPVDIYLKVMLKPKLVFISRSIAALSIVLSCYPLITEFDITGAVLSYAVCQAVMFLCLYYFAFKTWMTVTNPERLTNSM